MHADVNACSLSMDFTFGLYIDFAIQSIKNKNSQSNEILAMSCGKYIWTCSQCPVLVEQARCHPWQIYLLPAGVACIRRDDNVIDNTNGQMFLSASGSRDTRELGRRLTLATMEPEACNYEDLKSLIVWQLGCLSRDGEGLGCFWFKL